MTIRALQIAPNDDVAVALMPLAAGDTAGAGVLIRQAIPQGHKFALRAIAAGEPVLKYGWPIGRARVAIAPGEHVHVHNLATDLEPRADYALGLARTPDIDGLANGRFLGFRRQTGGVGIRNEIWVLSTVGCVARTAQKIAAVANRLFAGQVDGVYAFTHPFGCSQLGSDLDDTRAITAALASHPNAGGVLLVGLGCESNQLSQLLSALPPDRLDRVGYVAAQAVDDEIEAGLKAVKALVERARDDRREECSLADLVVGLKCGGSDGFSGLTANPLVGDIADRVCSHGGSAVLTEIPEIFGAEPLLMRRAKDGETAQAVGDLVNAFKAYFTSNGQPVSENPSPGNKEGGITTLEEKSLGAVQKAGRSPLTGVVPYGGRIAAAGLSLLEAPGNDAISSTALAAAGATVILFTTGRGTPLGFPVPTLKIATNSELAIRKPTWIDFDAGALAQGAQRHQLADDLMSLLLATASGQQTRSEINEEREIAIWKRGVTL